MEQQTESHTPVENKSMWGEATFRLRAQDITADLLVDLWIMVQIRLKAEQRQHSLAEGVENVRNYFGVPRYPSALFTEEHAKLKGAAEIAEAMRLHSPRKLAD